jgi:hypothetical protein
MSLCSIEYNYFELGLSLIYFYFMHLILLCIKNGKYMIKVFAIVWTL